MSGRKDGGGAVSSSNKKSIPKFARTTKGFFKSMDARDPNSKMKKFETSRGNTHTKELSIGGALDFSKSVPRNKNTKSTLPSFMQYGGGTGRF